MLREQSALIVKIHKGLDIALTVISFISAYFIKRILPAPLGGLTTEPSYYVVLLLIIIIWYLCFEYFGLYESYRKQTLRQILLQMLKAVATGIIFLFLVLYISKIFDVSRLLLFIFCIIDIGLLTISKSAVYLTLKKYRSNGYNYRNMLVVGSR